MKKKERYIMKNRKAFLAALFLGTVLIYTGCCQNNQSKVESTGVETTVSSGESSETTDISDTNLSDGTVNASSSTLLDTTQMFSDRDLEQEADLSEATQIALESGKDVTIDSEGVYVIAGIAENTTIIVDADSAKVQLVLDGVSITNTDSPAIYVKDADKVFITTTDSDNSLSVTGTFTADGDTNTDAVIFSKADLVLNGKGSLAVTSTENGISGKDDVKFTGGTYTITTTEGDAVEAKDSIRICDGSFTIESGKDGLHSENEDDLSLGYIYISGGTFDIDAKDDGIQATSVLMIDGGTLDVSAAEALEGTYIQINDGTLQIYATDDGINASSKSTEYDVTIEINGGEVSIEMASGDTDALDANGNLYINGGTVDITAQFAFDFDNEGKLNGGTVTVNGEEVTEITNSMMMGGPGQGQGGPGGFGGGNPPEGFDGSSRPEMPEGIGGGNPPERPEDGNQKGNGR